MEQRFYLSTTTARRTRERAVQESELHNVREEKSIMSVLNLGYVILAVRDRDEWVKVAEEVIGFALLDRAPSEGASYLRMDAAPFRYMLVPGDADRFVAAGWECASKETFEGLIAALESAGAKVERGDEEGAAQRAVRAFAKSSDPSGNVFEFYYGRSDGGAFRPGLGVSEFKTGDMGMGHVVLPASETDETHRFYKDVLGFGDSDDLTLPPPADGAPEQRVIFLHADNPRHHALALYNFPHPVGMIHLMVEMSTLDEVGACLDRVKKAGLPLLADLGRHSNDEMVSFYFIAPGGFCIEIGYDGLQVPDWSAFTPTKSTTGDIWGHEYNLAALGQG